MISHYKPFQNGQGITISKIFDDIWSRITISIGHSPSLKTTNFKPTDPPPVPVVAHLTANHDVGDLGFAVGAAVRLVVAGAHRQDKVPRVALALPHQEAAVLALLRQELLRLPARQVSVEPSDEHWLQINEDAMRRRQDTASGGWGGGV